MADSMEPCKMLRGRPLLPWQRNFGYARRSRCLPACQFSSKHKFFKQYCTSHPVIKKSETQLHVEYCTPPPIVPFPAHLFHHDLQLWPLDLKIWIIHLLSHIECVHNHTSDQSDESDLLNFIQNQLRAKRFAFRIESRSARTRLRKIWLHGEIFY